MSKDIDNIVREIQKNNKEINNIDNHVSKDISELRKSIKNIENKIKNMDDTLEKLLDILNTITVFIEDANDSELDLNEEDESEDWTPYDDRNFTYEDDNESDGFGDSYYQDYEDN